MNATREPTGPSLRSGQVFAGGRYQVNKFLGEGGKKRVYLAHDTLLDREVALALLKTEGLDETARTRLRREAQAMGRLGSHPHIVTVFDLGESDGQPYIVTEFMGGGDVERLIEKAPQPPPAPGAGPGARRTGVPGLAVRPRQGDRAPRPEAGQRLADGGRRGQDRRFRPGAAAGPFPPDAARG